MLGTIVNSIAIILGALLGIIIKKGIKEKYKSTIMDGIGLSIMIIGIMGGIKTDNIVLIIASIVVGSIIGEIIDIDYKLEKLGHNMEMKFGKGDSNFSKGFVTASLVYCIGAMAIVGALESGLTGNHETLFAKSILDGITAILFASTFGIGVAFSAIPVFIYQGIITLLANSAKDLLTVNVINEMSAVGGILILAIGINLLGIKKIKVANMLPSIIIPLIYLTIVNVI
ncbi:DUF554 domain-containing protein [Paratissierella segnis]|jgi:hypothetical protein|uniref:DUF554 domain-containing protein n=1 Tax=Paratissierella segnis TaxID=2763679 RepID=A0A926EQ43_9FIRM|nr:DUF554 domain-containing protein [Paratissierella segnis]MBC8587658.1 DUF554 domain-containing protein [Paratissierella segnis]